MIGGLSSSLSTALRTATKARATMDTMARQMATGQRVSSVKDDGAAWARANKANGDARASQSLANDLKLVGASVSAARVMGEERVALIQTMVARAVRATDPSLSPSARTDLRNEQVADGQSSTLMAFGNHDDALTLNRLDGSGIWAPFAGVTESPGAGDLRWTSGIDGSTSDQLFGANAPSLTGWTNLTTVAFATNALGITQSAADWFQNRTQALASFENRLESESDWQAANADRLLSISASLTDADLGKASAARAQADTRQQIALQTVQQALAAYGNYAGGLLGNVQRTQRGLLV